MQATIEDTIKRVETLYTALTGQPAPRQNGPRAPIPPEVDAARYVEEQLDRLTALADQRAVPETASWTPAVSVWQETDDVVVSIDVPGVPRDSLEVSVTGNLLTISGRRPAPWGAEPASRPVHLWERPVGAFQRSVLLPVLTQSERMTARLVDGVLELRAPLVAAPVASKRAIPVS